MAMPEVLEFIQIPLIEAISNPALRSYRPQVATKARMTRRGSTNMKRYSKSSSAGPQRILVKHKNQHVQPRNIEPHNHEFCHPEINKQGLSKVFEIM